MRDSDEFKSAAQLLDQAHAVLSSAKWHQRDPMPESHCMATAIESAFQAYSHALVDVDYALHAIQQSASIGAGPSEPNELYWGADLVVWNDEPGRTKEEVLKVLSDAAGYARQKAATR